MMKCFCVCYYYILDAFSEEPWHASTAMQLLTKHINDDDDDEVTFALSPTHPTAWHKNDCTEA